MAGIRPISHKLLKGAAELLWPARCVGCDAPHGLLCESCAEKLPWVDQRWACPVCGAPYGWLTCTECHRDWESARCVCAFSFLPPASALVTVYKDGHERRLAGALGAAIAGAVEERAGWDGFDSGGPPTALADGKPLAVEKGVPQPGADGDTRSVSAPTNPAAAFDGVVFIPATAEALRRRGFDHMEAVAASAARWLGLPVADVLARRQAEDQRTLGKEARAANVQGTFEVLGEVGGARLLLVDDVVTTGASCREAVRALLARGAASVSVAAVARTW